MKSFTLTITTLLQLSTLSSEAQSFQDSTKVSSRCYRLETASPQDAHETPASPTWQTWCYYHRPQENMWLIYNLDSGLKPELSLLLESDGTLTHGSLRAGRITYHRVSSHDFNPYPIPLPEPVTSPRAEKPGLSDQVLDKMVETLAAVPAPATVFSGPVELQQSRRLSGQARITPWRGFWWAYRNQHLSRSENSPLGKYDRFLRARGLSAGARSWENTYHRYKGIKWEGHCNGWAASSILRSEPRRSRRDSRSGVTFSIDDQKGLLAEMDYCASVSFYGRRYRGRAGDNIRDISPAEFHKTVLYYIGELRKPVIMDYVSGVAVDNHPVSKYDMTIVRRGSRSLEVTARMTFHKYDSRTQQRPGPAPAYIRTYRYRLTEDASGRIVSGSWISSNPDFIWVPLSLQDCARNNPYLKLNLMSEILSL
ncbi:MAG: hypothetical protein ACK5Y2_03445 [Bdellovibrionales bacterium]